MRSLPPTMTPAEAMEDGWYLQVYVLSFSFSLLLPYPPPLIHDHDACSSFPHSKTR